MKVLVLFESNTGNTRTVAESIGGAARAAGAEVNVRSVRHIDLHELSTADVVFLGTWVDGLILFGHRPGGVGASQAYPLWITNGWRCSAPTPYMAPREC